MKIEDQVVSFLLSLRIKTLKVNQNGYFVWAKHKRGPQVCAESAVIHSEKMASAFTVAELGEILPPDTDSGKKGTGYSCWQVFSEDGDETHWDNLTDKNGNQLLDSGVDFEAATEADARAKMLIYLLEKKLYTPK